MSWLEKLYLTYENNLNHIGDPNDKIPLLPVAHTLQNAQVTIHLDQSGNFLRASLVPRDQSSTVIPATEDSAGRAGIKPVPHALADKLQFVAGDFAQFGGDVTSGYAANPSQPHKYHLKQLTDWCDSAFAVPKVLAVLSYEKKGQVVADLAKEGILPLDANGKLLKVRPGRSEESPVIFRVLPSSMLPEDIFIRWSVEVPGDLEHDLWKDDEVWKSWSNYQASLESGKGLCYVTGRETFLASNHPKRIRRSTDNAKLISSPSDPSAYLTYLGRFTNVKEACGVGYEVTQKAHSALRWLIARQSYRDDHRAFCAWAISGIDIPDLLLDTASLISSEQANSSAITEYISQSQDINAAQDVGRKLSSLIAGYSAKLGDTDGIVVMGLDSATPGRMSITFYRELTGSEFLERVESWHDPELGCTWWQMFDKQKKFFGAPAPKDIAEAAYGIRIDDKLRRSTIERLLPCIIDGTPIPRDLVESCVRAASQRIGNKEDNGKWEKTLGIACALFRHYQKERRYQVTLETNRTTRDYLYGRLLALGEHMEERALYLAGEERDTNAARLMQRFADRPYSTWLQIEKTLVPYTQRLQANRPGLLTILKRQTDEVFDLFEPGDFCSDAALTGEFLLGYHCQRSTLWKAKPQEDDKENKSIEET